jgi:ABC-2 type transport system ATP-binding protein
LISIQGFHKAYDQTVAVHDLTFEVEPGSVLGLVGPNGAGKTTTLRAIAGIIPTSQGTMCIAGNDIDKSPVEAKLRLAYVPDDPQLFRDLTVEQNLAFTASAYQVANPDSKALELLETFQLTPKRQALVSELSRGMRQKLAICCAYLHAPQALLLDEPITGLDPHGIRMFKNSVVQQADRGCAVIISSHLLSVVEDICTHVLILNSGQQRFCGSLDDFRSTFAADNSSASLEEVYFLATDQADSPAEVNC